MNVRTYQYRYLSDRRATLCESCADSPTWAGILGPISHGLHDGTCETCEMITAGEMERRCRAEAARAALAKAMGEK